MSEKRIIANAAGVLLTEVRLAGVSGVTGYTVSSNRTPECPSFDTEAAARAYFDAEVARCRGAAN